MANAVAFIVTFDGRCGAQNTVEECKGAQDEIGIGLYQLLPPEDKRTFTEQREWAISMVKMLRNMPYSYPHIVTDYGG